MAEENIELYGADVSQYGVCPWSGTPCPGPEGCAPAVLAAKSKALYGEPGTKAPAPECPIMVQTEQTEIISAALFPFLHGQDKYPEEETEEETRSRVLGSMKLDQQ